MLQRYKELLFASENQWISIGITKTGEDVGAISVPWSITAHAFNMKTPNIYISVVDIYDERTNLITTLFRKKLQLSKGFLKSICPENHYRLLLKGSPRNVLYFSRIKHSGARMQYVEYWIMLIIQGMMIIRV